MRHQSELREKFFANGRADDCPVHDLHGHMGTFYGAHFPIADASAMIRAMDRAGVKLLVFCSHAALLAPDVGNLGSIESVRRFPDKLRAYCAVNPNYPDVVKRDVETFDSYADVYVGFKFLADYHGRPMTDSGYQPAWELANSRRLLVLIHTWGGSSYDGAEQVRTAAEKYPNANILVGHSIHGDWDSAIGLANEFPNVYLDLCAVVDERGILERFVERVGSKKIVFGTDLPWFDLHYYIGAVLGADITDDDRRRIFYKNAEEILCSRL